MSTTPPALSMKAICLAVLSVQTASHVLVTRYSRQNAGPTPYLPTVSVSFIETIKLVCCVLVILFEKGFKVALVIRLLKREILERPLETMKLAIPAGLYTVQNNLLIFALSNLDSATYQVCYQVKILTTAMFSVILLGRKLRSTQWLSLFILTVGVALVQLAQSRPSPDAPHTQGSATLGMLSIIAAACTSGFCGVYFEMLLKNSDQELWIRNTQMAIFGCLIGWGSVGLNDFEKVSAAGILQGFNFSVWMVIALGVASGFTVALVVKYADNILKGFAVSISILISTFISFYFLDDFRPSLGFLLGSSLVIASTFLYGIDFTSQKQKHK